MTKGPLPSEEPYSLANIEPSVQMAVVSPNMSPGGGGGQVWVLAPGGWAARLP